MTRTEHLVGFVILVSVLGISSAHVCTSSRPGNCIAQQYTDFSQNCVLKRYSVGKAKCQSGRPVNATHCFRNTTITVPCGKTVISIIENYRNSKPNNLGQTVKKLSFLTCYSKITKLEACKFAKFLWRKSNRAAKRKMRESVLRLLFRSSKKLYSVLSRNNWMDCDLPQGEFPDIFPRLLNTLLINSTYCDKLVDVNFLKGKLATIKGKQVKTISDQTMPSENRSRIVRIPPAAWFNTSHKVLSVVFHKSSLFFPSNETVHGITSVKIGTAESIKNLTEELQIEFRNLSPSNASQNLTCVYWRPSKSDWSTEGCRLNVTGEFPVCLCNHLTNFGLLINPTVAKMSGLAIFSTIGCILSIVFFALTIITHTINRETRRRRPVKILIQICINLMISMLIFVVGVERTRNGSACMFITFILHYFLLCGWCWMSVYSYDIYHSLVKVFRLSQRRYIQKASLIAYGLPLVVATSTAIFANVLSAVGKSKDCVGTGQYRSKSYCWLGCNSLFFGFLMPVGAMLLFNLGVFVAVTVELYGVNKKVHCPMLKRSSMQAVVLALTMTSINGITWTLGLMQLISTNVTYYTILNWLFVATSATQGLFVFLFTSVRHEDTRHEWMGTARNWYSSVKRAVQWDSRDSSTLSVSRPDSTGQTNADT